MKTTFYFCLCFNTLYKKGSKTEIKITEAMLNVQRNERQHLCVYSRNKKQAPKNSPGSSELSSSEYIIGVASDWWAKEPCSNSPEEILTPEVGCPYTKHVRLTTSNLFLTRRAIYDDLLLHWRGHPDTGHERFREESYLFHSEMAGKTLGNIQETLVHFKRPIFTITVKPRDRVKK